MSVVKLKIALQERCLVDISFSLNQTLALVGQSGSGKSLTLKALLGMLPNTMSMELEHDFDFTFVRGESVALIPQNPFTALSPLTKIKKQFFASKQRVAELFEALSLKRELLERFPPELSGGQLQRVVIAMALESQPKLLLLDEPTTALDPETRISIIALLKELHERENFQMLFVTHDIASAKQLCEDICVIKDGIIVESGKMLELLTNPKEAYTKRLIEASFEKREFRK